MRREQLKKSAKVIKSPFADNTCRTNRGNGETEDELGWRTKQSEASYWLILVNYPRNEKQKQRLAN